MPAAATTPRRLACPCGRAIDIPGLRVGDAVRCPACNALRVVIRSRATGDVPPAMAQAGALAEDERREVADALRRIKLRRVGTASRHVSLYPTWAVFAAGAQFYLSGVLAGANLRALGDVAGGRRLQRLAVGAYLVIAVGFTAVWRLLGDSLATAVLAVAFLAAVPLAFASYFTLRQLAACRAAREAGATNAPVAVPLLIGFILAIAQAFFGWFLRFALEGPWA